jgi:hypothetical protein
MTNCIFLYIKDLSHVFFSLDFMQVKDLLKVYLELDKSIPLICVCGNCDVGKQQFLKNDIFNDLIYIAFKRLLI